MPRKKIYRTKEEKRKANCEKSARYYKRNQNNIKAKSKEYMRELRASLKKEAESAEVAARRANRDANWRRINRREQQYCKKYSHTSDVCWRVGDLQNSLDQDLGRSAYDWLDRVYQDYQERAMSSSPSMKCPLDTAANMLLSYIRTMEDLSQEVINQFGAGDDWRCSRQFIKRVRLLLESCYDMETKIIDPDKCLEDSYSRGELSFQKKEIRAWIDGKAPLPE
ncbi:hypothetical protein VNI00_018003 [Paramarasmius palmivorus]|uniref:Uncharacterized protein n=1 Tax=Paramarasmius palmivorus TaxID=297713 RepID=A0AAW0B344_9AGAR